MNYKYHIISLREKDNNGDRKLNGKKSHSLTLLMIPGTNIKSQVINRRNSNINLIIFNVYIAF